MWFMAEFPTIRHFSVIVLSPALFLIGSCRSTLSPLTLAEVAQALPDDEITLRNIASHNAGLQREFRSLESSGGWRKRGYFSAEESDRAELLYFRFHTTHHQLCEIDERYAMVPADSPSSKQATAIRTRTNRLALEQAHFMVSTFGGDPVAVAKLNQAFPRSAIPRDTYDHLAGSLETPAKRVATAAKVKLGDDLSDSEYLAQMEIFFHVSRLREPNAHLVSFSSAQKQEMVSLLQPGDILLTFTAGYASDVFIPGAFKHGITFVGTVAQREAAGLSPDRIILVGGNAEGKKIARDLREDHTVHGRSANVIEAIAEGVKFSNLDHILDTHINRILVLRPELGEDNRARQVSRTFSYLGQDYDFRFDFADASKQVCTEVIYRAISGLDDIEFPLTRRGGHVTLSADDLVNYWIHTNPNAFRFVLYAEEAPASPGHRARIMTGAKGKTRVKALMASGGRN
jgi:hypothetical protein